MNIGSIRKLKSDYIDDKVLQFQKLNQEMGSFPRKGT